MNNHQKAEDIIKSAERMLGAQSEPHVMEWFDMVEGLKEQLKHYVLLVKTLEHSALLLEDKK